MEESYLPIMMDDEYETSDDDDDDDQIGRAHVWTPVTQWSRMPSSAWKKKKTKK